MRTRQLLRSFLPMCIAITTLAYAADDVQSTLRVSRVVTAGDGTVSREGAQAARPGDVLEYVAEYHNTTMRLIRQLAATLPIPLGTEFMPDSSVPPGTLASLDGATFAAIPLKRKTIRPDGRMVEQTVPYSEYRYLRWPSRDLGAGQTLQVQARARLIAGSPAAAAAR